MEVEDGCSSFDDVAAQLALVLSMAEAMGIDSTYVFYVGCVSSTGISNRRNLQSKDNAVDVTTETRVPTTEVSQDDVSTEESSNDAETAENAYEYLKNRLTTTVESGNFTTILRRVSREEGVNATANVEVQKELKVGEMEMVFPPSASPVQESSDDSIFYMIIISIMGGLLLIVSGLFFWSYYWKTERGKVYANVCDQGDDTMDAVRQGTILTKQRRDEESADTLDITRVYPGDRDVSYDMPPRAITVGNGEDE